VTTAYIKADPESARFIADAFDVKFLWRLVTPENYADINLYRVEHVDIPEELENKVVDVMIETTHPSGNQRLVYKQAADQSDIDILSAKKRRTRKKNVKN
jgi:hypothetical protein